MEMRIIGTFVERAKCGSSYQFRRSDWSKFQRAVWELGKSA